MIKVFTDNAWEDDLYRQSTDKAMVKKINSLIKDIERNPCTGLGKPEPLRSRDIINFLQPCGCTI